MTCQLVFRINVTLPSPWSHLPRGPGREVLDDDAVVGLPAGRVAAPDRAAAAPAEARRGTPEAVATASALTGELHANPVKIPFNYIELLPT